MKNSRLSVIHTVAGLHPRCGGPSKTVPALVSALQQEGSCSVRLVSQGLRSEFSDISLPDGANTRIALSKSRLALTVGLPFFKQLRQVTLDSPPALIHDHGIWLPSNHYAAATARRLKIPFVIHPRGMLVGSALGYRSWKKQLALNIYQRRDLYSAAIFIATAELEAESIRRVGLRQPIAVIPNGVQLDVPQSHGIGQTVHQRICTALFLSRIHPIKGLINLVRAWGQLRPPNWRLLIAGPDEIGHLADVMAAVHQEGIKDVVEYIGEVDGERKASVYQNADLFVLPSFSENFGMVVAEALAHGLPVITTRGTPWVDLPKYDCGWWIDTGVEPLVDALRQAIELSSEEQRAMGERGRAYVQRYNWSDIARQTADVYFWVLGKGPKPDCVRSD